MDRIVSTLLLTATLFLAGCFSYAAGGTADLERWPPLLQKPDVRIGLLTSWRLEYEGKPRGLTRKELSEFTEAAVQAFAEAGRFTAVGPGISDSELRAELRFDLTRPRPPFLVPWRTSDVLELEVIVWNASGKRLGRVEASGAVRSWWNLVVVCCDASVQRQAVLEKAVFDLTRRAVLEAVDEGLL